MTDKVQFCYVVTKTENGAKFYGTNKRLEWTSNFAEARTFKRTCDAKNSNLYVNGRRNIMAGVNITISKCVIVDPNP